MEQQLEGMLQPTVQLRSGGYLVINQTEALVAIDVNSGRSTRERGIEETALKTNLEAAEETARQLRLRDLAGLIVIDFIDMESRRNVAAVERKLKDALKHDRARIQVGGISHFGLLEMSRQRLRPSLAETNFVTCTHCGGTGHMRSTESAALVTLRAIEDEGGRRRAAEIVVYCASSIALYILNHKRQRLTDIETRYSMLVAFVADETLMPPQLRIEKIRAQTMTDAPAPVSQLAPPEPFEDPDEIEMGAEIDESMVEEVGEGMADDGGDDDNGDQAGEPGDERAVASADGDAAENERRGRRRRRRRGGRREEGSTGSATEAATVGAGQETGQDAGDLEAMADESGSDAPEADSVDAEMMPVTAMADAESVGTEADSAGDAPTADAEEGERRRRGRRGGRRRRRDGSDAEAAPSVPAEAASVAPASPPAYSAPAYSAPAYTAPAYSAPAYSPPVYEGPTPANPFGGASAFDIFDAIEQAEEQRLMQPKPTRQASPAPMPASDPVPETAAELAPELASVPPEVEPGPIATPPVAAPVVEPVSEPVAGPMIQPVLIGGEAEPVERKKGWWRR